MGLERKKISLTGSRLCKMLAAIPQPLAEGLFFQIFHEARPKMTAITGNIRT
jgi:hypothetical protein